MSPFVKSLPVYPASETQGLIVPILLVQGSEESRVSISPALNTVFFFKFNDHPCPRVGGGGGRGG